MAGVARLLLLLASSAKATQLAPPASCPCAGNAAAHQAQAGVVLTQTASAPMGWMYPTAPPPPKLEVPPAVPLPPLDPPPPPPPPAIPELPDMPAVGPEDIPVQTLARGGPNGMEHWMTIPPTVPPLPTTSQLLSNVAVAAAWAEATRVMYPPTIPPADVKKILEGRMKMPFPKPPARRMRSAPAAAPAAVDGTKLLPKYIPVPRKAQVMTKWATEKIEKGIEMQAERHLATNWPTPPMSPYMSYYNYNAAPGPGLAPAPAPAQAAAAFLQKRTASERGLVGGGVHCPCAS
eukprot:TRINITY_DN909_c0_g1_i1.p1 TRINITY_DN909_c0_g1~~TRINITY_DN909_c0_g1_i1.p1  ORF type:complete len:310 (+),score=56.98 TRINITY_DN909_c0_g1_i1:60-932(+)